jgi:hypothetical protein
LIGKIVEIYIDDVMIKSLNHDSHLEGVKRTLECTRKHGLKMNPNKCAFGVSARELLGFLVHEGGIEVGKKSMKAIDEVVPPTNLKELQSLLGKNNFLRRFILNLPQKVLPFSPLLRIKKDQKFVWGGEQQKAFDEIKWYVKEPPVLVPPQLNKPFKLYVVADAQTIGSALRPSTLVVLQNLLQSRSRSTSCPRFLPTVINANDRISRSNAQPRSNLGQPGPSPRKTH